VTVAGSGPVELDFDLDGLALVIGPTDERPLDQWLPQAVDLMKTTFRVKRRQRQVANYLTQMLARIGQPDSVLPYRVFRWLALEDVPFVASFGLVERDIPEEEYAFLQALDSEPVEAPTVEQLAASEGCSVRRTISYSQPDDTLLVEVRYVVDTGHPKVLARISGGGRAPGDLVAALDDLDAFALSMRVTPVA
jgi:hypothetical protein